MCFIVVASLCFTAFGAGYAIGGGYWKPFHNGLSATPQAPSVERLEQLLPPVTTEEGIHVDRPARKVPVDNEDSIVPMPKPRKGTSYHIEAKRAYTTHEIANAGEVLLKNHTDYKKLTPKHDAIDILTEVYADK